MIRISFVYLFPTFLFFISCNRGPAENPVFTGYTDRSACISCHEEEYHAFTHSHHDLAMEPANEQTILGNFNDHRFIHFGDTARFYRKGVRYYVYTAGEDGIYQEFEVEYTFGWTPLQQYLIRFPRGHYQVLPFCWDTRSADEGGQRWFHIYDQERIPPHDQLHWTKAQQNWNHVCAECHSTNLKKNYNIENLSFSTDWSEIDVSCDACHGPSANHLKWAELHEKGEPTERYPNMGYAFSFPDDSAYWEFRSGALTAVRSKPRSNHAEIELCARCHSRRLQIWEDYTHGEELMQTHVPVLLEPDFYYPDGQIKEEVYVYGSFLQSRMYKSGVTCSDCHDPHSMQVKAPGNTLCLQCHAHDTYNSYGHHFHDVAQEGGSCLDCHMPETNYMVVDPRRDHSMRIPRPDLSLKIGSPNACTQCHTDESDEWADTWFRKWYGNKYDTIQHYGEVFHAANQRDPAALADLLKVSEDTALTDIVRASALHYLQQMPSMKAVNHLRKMTTDSSALVRMTAINILNRLHGSQSLDYIMEGLTDEVRAVRYISSNAYAGIPYIEKADRVTAKERKTLNEYIRALMVNADQPASHTNLGIYYQHEDKLDSALHAYQTALRIDSGSVEAAIDIADLYRIEGRDEEGEEILLRTLGNNPGRHELYLALGLVYTRQNETEKSLSMLSQAYRLDPQNTYYIYVYGVALNSYGEPQKALEILEKGYEVDPWDYNLLNALAAISRDIGDMKRFHKYYDQIVRMQQTLN